MKILMVLSKKFPIDIRVENEATTLIKAGHHVGILSIADYAKSEIVYEKDIKVYREAVSSFTRNKMLALAGMIPWVDYVVARKLIQILKQENYDAIHFHDLYLFGAARLVKSKYAVKFIGDMHENYVEVIKDYQWATKFPNRLIISQKKWETKEIKWLQDMDRVITVSEGILERIVRKGVEKKHAVLVPNTIHTKVFDEFETDNKIIEKFKGYFTLVYVGGFVSNRGLEHVIEGMARLKERLPDLRLVLVGDGDYKKVLEQKVQEVEVEDVVFFEGWKDQKKIKSYLLACDVGLVPFKRTPQTDNSSSNKLFQYMYFSLPILATNCTSVKELVKNENCGIVYESENISQFIEATLKLYENEGLRKELGKNGYQSVMQKYSWDATTKDMTTMYSELES